MRVAQIGQHLAERPRPLPLMDDGVDRVIIAAQVKRFIQAIQAGVEGVPALLNVSQ
jgi:hypothetical protein